MKTIATKTTAVKPPEKNTIPFHRGFEPTQVTVMVERVGIMIPVMLPKRLLWAITKPHPRMGGEYFIPATEIGSARSIESRVDGWTRYIRLSGGIASPTMSDLFRKACVESCDSRIKIIIPQDEWPLVVEVSQRLGISVNDWFLAGAAWAAWYLDFLETNR